eukprot:jgi/Tetstr1/461041/TSEL_006191.t1
MQREVYEVGDDRDFHHLSPVAVLIGDVLVAPACIAAQLYDEVERAPVAVFDEFEALVLEAPLVVWDLCGARFPRSGARAAAIPTSARPVAVLIGDILVAPTASQPRCMTRTWLPTQWRK